MSTRCNVTLTDKQGCKAMLYKHHDGSPETMMPELASRLSAAHRRLSDKSYFVDSEKISAVMVALSTDESGVPDYHPCLTQHDDIEFRYDVHLADDDTCQITVDDDVTDDVVVYC